MKLDFSSFEKAVYRLEQSLTYFNHPPNQDPELKLLLMAATIQAFEFTYEISIKFLRRYLELTEPNSRLVGEMTFPTLIRTACERGLLKNDWSNWKQYRDKRNITSHTYDNPKAEEIMQVIPKFLAEAKHLLHILKTRSKK